MAKKHKRNVAVAEVMESPAAENLMTEVVETPAAENLTIASDEVAEVNASVAKPVKVRYAKRVWAAGDIITLNTPNPKSGKSKNRYDLYVTGMSVAEYATAVVNHGGSKTLANADLRWDVARNFITISAPAVTE